MPPCGCGKDDGMTMEERMKRYKMKFIGKPGGVLMKGAPSNYIQGEVYDNLPFSYSKMPYFEMLDPPPVLKVPAAQLEDSVFESSVFVPPDFDDATISNAPAVQLTKSTVEETKKILDIPVVINPDIKENEAKLIGMPIHPIESPSIVTIENLEVPAEPASGDDAKAETPNYQELFESVKGMKGKEAHAVNPLAPSVRELLESVKQKKEKPVKLEDNMPPELRAELRQLGDGVLEEDGIVKVEPKPKKVEDEDESKKEES